MKIAISSIQMSGTDSQGSYARAEVDGEWQGVSLRGEDEVVRDLSDISHGTKLDIGGQACVAVDLRGELLARLSAYDDGTGTIGVIVDQAIADGTANASHMTASVDAVRAIVAEAIADARAEA